MEKKRDFYLFHREVEQFTPVEISELHEGDIFAIYEPDGSFVGMFKAYGEPSVDGNGLWSIVSDTYFDH